jgi:hypothetical protein
MGKNKYSWNNIVNGINKFNGTEFNALELFDARLQMKEYLQSSFKDPFLYRIHLKYLSNLTKLEFIQKVSKDKSGEYIYKIIKKIPNDLTTSKVTMVLYDKMWKRKNKIKKLRERTKNNLL